VSADLPRTLIFSRGCKCLWGSAAAAPGYRGGRGNDGPSPTNAKAARQRGLFQLRPGRLELPPRLRRTRPSTLPPGSPYRSSTGPLVRRGRRSGRIWWHVCCYGVVTGVARTVRRKDCPVGTTSNRPASVPHLALPKPVPLCRVGLAVAQPVREELAEGESADDPRGPGRAPGRPSARGLARRRARSRSPACSRACRASRGSCSASGCPPPFRRDRRSVLSCAASPRRRCLRRKASASGSVAKRRARCWPSWRQRTTQAPRSGCTLTGLLPRTVFPPLFPCCQQRVPTFPTTRTAPAHRTRKAPR
jgi:hypothetical protein